MKTLREILKDGCQNGKEKVIKRKVRKELVKLKVWQQLAKNKQRMSLLQEQVQAVNKLQKKLKRKENDLEFNL